MYCQRPQAIYLTACLFVLALPSRGEAQAGVGCTLGLRGGLTVPAGVLGQMEPVGWTGATDFSCPVSGRIAAGAQFEVSRLEDLTFASIVGTFGTRVDRDGRTSGLLVRPQLHAGAAYQASHPGVIIQERPPREHLADDFVFTAGAGLDLGFDPKGFPPVFVAGRWHVHFNESEDFQFGDLPATRGYSELHRFTVSTGVLLNL